MVGPWGPRRRKRNWQAPVFILLAGALTLAALNVDKLHSWYSGRFGGSTADAPAAPALPRSARPTKTVAPETAAPTAAPSAVPEETPTVDRPWAGPPAADWPVGPDAIVLPQAKAIGVFDQDEVAAQLKEVKDYLVASNLDPAVLAGGRPQAALDLLGDKEEKDAESALSAPTKDNSPLSWFTRFDPRTAILVGNTVKVQGRMSVADDGADGVLVHVDYTFVYALRPGPEAGRTPSTAPGSTAGPTDGAKAVAWTVTPADAPSGDTLTARTIQRRTADFRFYDPAHYRIDPKKLYTETASSSGGNTGCDQSDGFLHPQFPDLNHTGPTPKPDATTEDPYDRSKPVPQSDGQCHHSLRS